jgi:hypothetical protein
MLRMSGYSLLGQLERNFNFECFLIVYLEVWCTLFHTVHSYDMIFQFYAHRRDDAFLDARPCSKGYPYPFHPPKLRAKTKTYELNEPKSNPSLRSDLCLHY